MRGEKCTIQPAYIVARHSVQTTVDGYTVLMHANNGHIVIETIWEATKRKLDSVHTVTSHIVVSVGRAIAPMRAR